MKDRIHSTPSVTEWLGTHLAPGCKVGVDPWLVSSLAVKKYKSDLNAKGIELIAVDENPVDQLWDAEGRLPPVKLPLKVHPLEFSGEDFSSKIDRVRREMDEKRVQCLIVTALDEIAWLFNIRGSDIAFNPVAMAYAIIRPTSAELYLDESQITPEVSSHLGDEVTVRPYSSLLHHIPSSGYPMDKIWLDPSTVNWAIEVAALKAVGNVEERIVREMSPIVV